VEITTSRSIQLVEAAIAPEFKTFLFYFCRHEFPWAGLSIREKRYSSTTHDICGDGWLVLTTSCSQLGFSTVNIAAICSGSPAACSARIAVGDEIVKVEGHLTEGLQASEVAELLKGAHRTILRMTLKESVPLQFTCNVQGFVGIE
jgi:C-terminal processing protease CtpA/Prc